MKTKRTACLDYYHHTISYVFGFKECNPLQVFYSQSQKQIHAKFCPNNVLISVDKLVNKILVYFPSPTARYFIRTKFQRISHTKVPAQVQIS